MFILNKEQLKEFDLRKAKRFIEFWESKYPDRKIKRYDDKNKPIEYIEELNLGNKLNEDNIKRLLRWKDPMRLTEEILSGPNKGKKNEKVIKVLKNLENINDFRFGKMSEKDFKEKTNKIFPNGIVWQIFLFHIARPSKYPIGDRNVFRAFSTQKHTVVPQNWDEYMHYMDYFFKVAISSKIITEKPKGDEKNIEKLVRKLKKVDNALFAFGRFLNIYNDTPH